MFDVPNVVLFPLPKPANAEDCGVVLVPNSPVLAGSVAGVELLAAVGVPNTEVVPNADFSFPSSALLVVSPNLNPLDPKAEPKAFLVSVSDLTPKGLSEAFAASVLAAPNIFVMVLGGPNGVVVLAASWLKALEGVPNGVVVNLAASWLKALEGVPNGVGLVFWLKAFEGAPNGVVALVASWLKALEGAPNDVVALVASWLKAFKGAPNGVVALVASWPKGLEANGIVV